MKFGKEIGESLIASNPEWGPFWINYKGLKKRLKQVVHEKNASKHSSNTAEDGEENHTDNSEADSLDNIESNVGEVEFFTELRKDLRRISTFYIAEVARYNSRMKQLQTALDEISEKNFSDNIQIERWMPACVHYYKDLRDLEKFAIMNYTGFSKILKSMINLPDMRRGRNT